jgi:hypothetical protein
MGADKIYEWYSEAHGSGEAVIGTYLYPYVLFGETTNDPYDVMRVVKKIYIEKYEIIVSHNGGLFVQPPKDLVVSNLSDLLHEATTDEHNKETKRKLQFQESVSISFNRLVCELALIGIVSEPITPAHISMGMLYDNRALIIRAGSGRERYLERSLFPMDQLTANKGSWLLSSFHELDILERAGEQNCTRLLVEVSEELPTLVSGAYSLFSKRHLSEALIDSWIVCEQFISHLWGKYIESLSDRTRIKRLKDTRTYSAAVCIEILHSVQIIPESIYIELNRARKHRNDLAHGAKITLSASETGLNAMRLMIEFFCNRTIAPPQISESVNW